MKEGEDRVIKKRGEKCWGGFFSGYLAFLALHQHIVQLLKAKINEVFRDLWQHIELKSGVTSDAVACFCTSKVSSIIMGAVSCWRIFHDCVPEKRKTASTLKQHVSIQVTKTSRSYNYDKSKEGSQVMLNKVFNPNLEVVFVPKHN